MPKPVCFHRDANRILTALLLIVLPLLMCSACSFGKAKAVAEPSVEQFHREFNAAQFHEIYSQSDDRMKKSATESQTVTLFEAIQRKLGKVQRSTQAQWTVNVTTGGTMVKLYLRHRLQRG